jgi:hypothetical protein
MKNCARCGEDKPLAEFRLSKGVPASYCRTCHNAYTRERRAKGKRDRTYPATAKAWRLRERDKAYDHYGGVCACCGEDERLFLTLDHVNNDGKEHRAKHPGLPMYLIAKAEGYPDDLQLLCYNCNCGKARNGGVCPHRR